MTMKTRLRSVQNIEAAPTAQLETLTKEDSRAAPESGGNEGLSTLPVQGSTSRGLTAVRLLLKHIFKSLNTNCIFITLCYCAHFIAE